MGVLRRTGTIAEEEIHDILRNERRRAVIQHLRRRVGSVSLRELSVAIAEGESGESPPPSDLRASVYNSLHQTHLPKLDGQGVIVYDRDRKTVELDEPAREVDVYMEVVGPYGVTWATFYRAFAICALLTLLAVELGAPLLAGLDERLVISGLLATLAGTTCYQLWHRRWMVLRALIE